VWLRKHYKSRRKERLKESASNCKDAVARPKLDPLQTLIPPATEVIGPSVMTVTILNSQWVVAQQKETIGGTAFLLFSDLESRLL